jgi:hypothetical protein
MDNGVLFWLAGIMTIAVALMAGAAVGYHFKVIYLRLAALKTRQDEIEQDNEPMPQVFEAKTPREVTKFGEPDEDSQIVQTKSPRDLRREKEQAEAIKDREYLEKARLP